MTEQPPTPEQPLDTHELGPVQMSASLHRLATALAKAQGEILPAPKDSKNPHFNSRYADLASIREACRLPLANNGLSVTQVPTNHNGEVTVLTILLHNSGEFIAASLTMRPQQATPQGIGSCITYARRYALAAMVGVAPDDDDANAASGQAPSQQQRPPQQQQPRTRQTSAAPPQHAAAPQPTPPQSAPAAPPVAAPPPQAPPVPAPPPAAQGPSAPPPRSPPSDRSACTKPGSPTASPRTSYTGGSRPEG